MVFYNTEIYLKDSCEREQASEQMGTEPPRGHSKCLWLIPCCLEQDSYQDPVRCWLTLTILSQYPHCFAIHSAACTSQKITHSYCLDPQIPYICRCIYIQTFHGIPAHFDVLHSMSFLSSHAFINSVTLLPTMSFISPDMFTSLHKIEDITSL